MSDQPPSGWPAPPPGQPVPPPQQAPQPGWPQAPGRGRAQAGIVLGWIGFLLPIGIILAIAIPAALSS